MTAATVLPLGKNAEPPAAPYAERAVLAHVLDPNGSIDSVSSLLRPEHFYEEASRRIYEAALDLANQGHRPSAEAVAQWLRERGRLHQVGGAEALGELMFEPFVFHAEGPAREILEKWQARQAIAVARRIVAEASNGAPVAKVLETARAQLENLERETTDGGAGVEILGAEAIFAPLEAPDYLVADIVRRGSLTLLGGYGSSGKTWLAIDLMIAVAAGLPWLGRFPSKPGRALLLEWEQGKDECRRRIQAVAYGHGITEWLEGINLVSTQPLYLNAPDAEPRLRALAKGRDLIVIDSLRAGSPGVDENDSAMREGLDRIRVVAERTGCAFVVITHAKKTSGSATKLDSREVLRGSSAIFDAADTVLAVTYEKDKPLRVDQVKARHGQAVEPFGVRLEGKFPDGSGVTVRECKLEEDETRTTPDERFEADCSRVLEAVRRHPGSGVRALRQRSGMMGARASAAIDELVAKGRIKNLGTASRPAYHAVGEGP